MNFQPLDFRYLPAEKNAGSAFTLLLLHGTGGNENDLLPLAGYFGKDVNVLSVRGNVLENGMPRFFRRLALGVFDENDVRFRSEELVWFLEEKARELGFDPKKIVALGFSNGANIAGALLMLFPEFLAGAVLLRPVRPLTTEAPFETYRQQPVLILSGQHDPMSTPGESLDYAELLGVNGFTLTHLPLNAGHNLVEEDIHRAAKWFKEHFSPVPA